MLWKVSGWHRLIYVSDDGASIVTAALNLIPLNVDDTFEVLGFWHAEQKVKTVSLAHIVPDRSVLVRTVSHFAWGEVNGIDETGRLRLTRIDGRVFRFSLRSGEVE